MTEQGPDIQQEVWPVWWSEIKCPEVLWLHDRRERDERMVVQKGFIAEGTLRSPVLAGLKQEEETTNTKRIIPEKPAGRWLLGTL